MRTKQEHYFLKIKVGSNLRPDMLGLVYLPIYCCFCFVSVVSPSSVETALPPCCVDNDNHHVSYVQILPLLQGQQYLPQMFYTV